MAYDLYDGTSAYKLDRYEEYTKEVTKKQEVKKAESKGREISKLKVAVILSIIFIVAAGFLYANAVLMETATKVNTLNTELEDMKVRNAQVSFEMTSDVDYTEVEEKAINEFGMQHPESYQNVYVDVVQNDYAELASAQKQDVGFVDKLISRVQAFLEYIR